MTQRTDSVALTLVFAGFCIALVLGCLKCGFDVFVGATVEVTVGKSERLQGGNDHVCTPEKIWRPIVANFGSIGLDPFSNPYSDVPATVRITDWGPQHKLPRGLRHGDGLAVPWTNVRGVVFLNGPYSTLGPWFAKAHESALQDQKQEIIIFGPVRTTHTAWHRHGFHGDAICFLAQRVKHPGEKDTAPFHQGLIYWGPRPELFAKVFNSHGTTFCAEEKFGTDRTTGTIYHYKAKKPGRAAKVR